MSDERSGTERVDESSGETPMSEHRSLRTLLGGAIFVLLVAGGFSYLMSEDPEERRETASLGAFTDGSTDDFDRPNEVGGLGSGPLGAWETTGGLWTVQAGVAFVAFPDPTLNIASVDARVHDVSVSSVVGGTGRCGIVIRYRDPRNFLAMLRWEDAGEWRVVEAVDGFERDIGRFPDEGEANMTVTLEVGQNIVTARAGLARMSAVAQPSQGGTRVGLIARGGDMSSCLWDDVTVRTATS